MLIQPVQHPRQMKHHKISRHSLTSTIALPSSPPAA
jgi:hypothetical protein